MIAVIFGVLMSDNERGWRTRVWLQSEIHSSMQAMTIARSRLAGLSDLVAIRRARVRRVIVRSLRGSSRYASRS